MAQEYQAAYTYVLIIYIGTLPRVLYNMIVAVLRAYGDSFAPFMFLVDSTIANVGLDLLFICVFGWGVAVSAWATVISQGLAALGAIVYTFVKYPQLRIKKSDWKLTFDFVLRNLKNGLPLGFQFSILEIGIIMQAAVVAYDVDTSGMADPIAWTAAVAIMLIPTLIYVYKGVKPTNDLGNRHTWRSKDNQ